MKLPNDLPGGSGTQPAKKSRFKLLTGVLIGLLFEIGGYLLLRDDQTAFEDNSCAFPHPGGMPENSPAILSPGSAATRLSSAGTAEADASRFQPSLRDGTARGGFPAIKSPGYSQVFLRNNPATHAQVVFPASRGNNSPDPHPLLIIPC